MSALSSSKLLEIGTLFNNPNANREELVSSACKLICGLYCDKAEKVLLDKYNTFSLNELRYLHYCKGNKKKNFNSESLPPTEGAAVQHAFRTYRQVQAWLGNDKLTATEWGWKIVDHQLLPIPTADPPMPKQLLQQISCSCKGKCSTMSCGCRKHGLRCTDLCVNCLQSEDETVGTCENFDFKAPIIDDEEELNEKIDDVVFPNFDASYTPVSNMNDGDSDDGD